MPEVAGTSEVMEEIIDDFVIDGSRPYIRVRIPKASAEDPFFSKIMAEQLATNAAHYHLGVMFVDGLPCIYKPAPGAPTPDYNETKVCDLMDACSRVWKSYYELSFHVLDQDE